MTVNVLERMDQWRSWKSDVEDYTEETLPGIRGYLEKAKESEEEIDGVDVDERAWEQRERDAVEVFEEVYSRRRKKDSL